MSFEVVILGSGAAVPTLRRNSSSQYINCNDRHILIDCGEGTQLQLRKFGIKLQRINHILISHLHGDHFFGLVGLLSTMHLMGRDKGLTIYGPVGLEEIIRSQLELGCQKLDFFIKFIHLSGRETDLIFEDKMIEIHTFPLKHGIPTNGFLIKEKEKERKLLAESVKGTGLKLADYPKLKQGINVKDEEGNDYDYRQYTKDPQPSFSYAYCSDTSYSEKIIPLIREVTVLYHEATFTHDMLERARATFHSTALQAAKIASQANVGKLLLGHLSARYEDTENHLVEACSLFSKTIVVEDGMKIIIG